MFFILDLKGCNDLTRSYSATFKSLAHCKENVVLSMLVLRNEVTLNEISDVDFASIRLVVEELIENIEF